jgi:hypothetical protein
MAITEQKVWVTSNGTVCHTLESAERAEQIEQISPPLDAVWADDGWDIQSLLTFLRDDPSAKPFVEAINHLYNQNPVSKTDAA